jgi:DNA-binding SARP family transcriptional activator
VWLRLVGDFTIGRADRPWMATEAGSRKARTLLALLAVEHRRLVPIHRIVEVLWGCQPPQRPTENVATLVSRLRARLGRDVIFGRGTGYRLGDSVTVDLFEAAAYVTAAEVRLAEGDPVSALMAAERALELIDDDEVLPDHPDAGWAERARDIHAGLLRRARHSAAAAALAAGDARAAGAAAESAVAADPMDERGCRALMRAYHMAGEPARALSAYERLRTTLATELGIDPSAPTRDLHVAILREREVSRPGQARTVYLADAW